MRYNYTQKELLDAKVEIGEKYTLDYRGIPITLYRVFRTLKRPKIKREIKPCIVVANGGRKKMYIAYKLFGTSSISAAKLYYIWFNGDIENIEYDIDHIDNNSLNNDIENLQLLTHRENCMKKYLDDPTNYEKDVEKCAWMRVCKLCKVLAHTIDEEKQKELLEKINNIL